MKLPVKYARFVAKIGFLVGSALTVVGIHGAVGSKASGATLTGLTPAAGPTPAVAGGIAAGGTLLTTSTVVLTLAALPADESAYPTRMTLAPYANSSIEYDHGKPPAIRVDLTMHDPATPEELSNAGFDEAERSTELGVTRTSATITVLGDC